MRGGGKVQQGEGRETANGERARAGQHAGCPGPARQGYGITPQLRPQKGLLLVRTPTTPDGICCSQPASNCTLCQHSCTHLAPCDWGYPLTLKASNLGHFSIVYGQESAMQILVVQGRGPLAPDESSPFEVGGPRQTTARDSITGLGPSLNPSPKSVPCIQLHYCSFSCSIFGTNAVIIIICFSADVDIGAAPLMRFAV